MIREDSDTVLGKNFLAVVLGLWEMETTVQTFVYCDVD